MKTLGVKNTLSKILILILVSYFCIGEDLPTPTTQEDEVEGTLRIGIFKIVTLLHTMNASLEKFHQKLNGLEIVGRERHRELIKNDQELTKKISLIEENMASLMESQQAHMESTSCGGSVKVAPGLPSTIRYPYGGDYSNNERCAWHIHGNPGRFTSYRIKVNSISVDEGHDGITIYFHSYNGELKSQKITTFGTWTLIEGPGLLLTFCTDGSTVGKGFQATIIGVGAQVEKNNPIMYTTLFKNPSQPYSYPVGTNNSTYRLDKVIVTPERGQSIRVILSSEIQPGDSIRFYELTCQRNVKQNLNLIGSQLEDGSGTTNNPRNSSYPVLVIIRRKSASWFKLDFLK